jgi:SAM-dependent methyltransferase
MNRERQLRGSNSYQGELGLDILSFLRDCSSAGPVSWIDLCCGTGRALIEAAAETAKTGAGARFQIEGIDLAGLFEANVPPRSVTFRKRSLESWEPTGPYALVTCVHGLHYVGDKLGAIAKAAAKLLPEGLFVANLDLSNFRHAGGRPLGRMVATRLRENALTYNARRRLVCCTGPHQVDFGLRHIGADDQVGPNYTGQPAVDSYYKV